MKNTTTTVRYQCSKCPWRVDTDPRDIPRGYSEKRHRALARTIADPGALNLGSTLRIMSCHDTHDEPCVGWLSNQLGPGNNIALRLAVIQKRVSAHFELVGAQHETFEETLPR